MIEGIKTKPEQPIKQEKNVIKFNWTGKCKVCGKQTRMKKVKSLDSSLHRIDYVQTGCGHRFLIEHEDKKVI